MRHTPAELRLHSRLLSPGFLQLGHTGARSGGQTCLPALLCLWRSWGPDLKSVRNWPNEKEMRTLGPKGPRRECCTNTPWIWA